jgi:type VI secretion system secreted protein VgrG
LGTHFETIDLDIDIDGTVYEVERADLAEGISEVGVLLCDITLVGGPPDPASLMGLTAAFQIKLRNTPVVRQFNGVVVSAVRKSDADGRPFVRTEIVPRAWRLTKRTNCRIFQEMTVQDIVTQVLDEAGVRDYAWTLGESYSPREYCCQYRESDWDFVMRLLSEEGIIVSVSHHDNIDEVLFTDDGAGFGDLEPAILPFVTLQGFDTLRPQVTNLRRTTTVVSDKVFTKDYDPERPKYELKTESESVDDGEHSLEIYRYPGRFIDEGEGERKAKALLHSVQATRDEVSGELSLLTVTPGFRFTVEGHPHEAFNTELMLVSMRVGTKDRTSSTSDDARRDYECQFRAVPTARGPYKAPRRRPTKWVPGTQTVFVTGAAGSEIHPDDKGRIKARFLWDRTDPSDDNSSRWIRTEQPNTPDSMLMPRVGWEVSVRYRDGDIDEPLCMGRLYNALAPPPYKLPDDKVRSSMQTATSPGDGSSNELRMHDGAGAEEVYVNASKDLTINVGNSMTLNIGNNEERTIGSNHNLAISNTLQCTVGGNQSITVKGGQDVSVETFMLDDVGGDHSLTIGGARDLKVGGDHKFTVDGSQTKEVSGNQTDLVVGAVEEKCDADWKHDVGAALVELTCGNRDITVAGNKTETIGALKAIVTKGGRGTEIAGNLTLKVAGAIINRVKGDRSETAGGTYTDLVAGAQIIKAKNITFEGESLVAVVMGASTLIVSSPAILLAGTSVKWDGETKDAGALILDN